MSNRVVGKDIEPNLVLAPSATPGRHRYNQNPTLLDKKLASNKTFRADDTIIIVSVPDRADRDLIKRFNNLNIIN